MCPRRCGSRSPRRSPGPTARRNASETGVACDQRHSSNRPVGADHRGAEHPARQGSLMALRLTGTSLPTGPPSAAELAAQAQALLAAGDIDGYTGLFARAAEHEDAQPPLPGPPDADRGGTCGHRAGIRGAGGRASSPPLPRRPSTSSPRSRASRCCSTTPASRCTSCGASTRQRRCSRRRCDSIRRCRTSAATSTRSSAAARQRGAEWSALGGRQRRAHRAGSSRQARSRRRAQPASGLTAQPVHDRPRRGGDAPALPGGGRARCRRDHHRRHRLGRPHDRDRANRSARR